MAIDYPSKSYCVYLLKDPQSESYKIGRTSNLKRRLGSLNTSRPQSLILVDCIPMESQADAIQGEAYAHYSLHPFRITREWFALPNLRGWEQIKLLLQSDTLPTVPDEWVRTSPQSKIETRKRIVVTNKRIPILIDQETALNVALHPLAVIPNSRLSSILRICNAKTLDRSKYANLAK